jgi:hypothetical protein
MAKPKPKPKPLPRAKREEPDGTRGAPRLVIDWDVMRRAASIGCTCEETAALLGISRAAFFTHLREDEGLQEAYDEAASQGQATLRRLQWQRANNGSDTMLIWLGKNLLGQTDRQALTGGDGGPIAVDFRWADATPQPVTIDASNEPIAVSFIVADETTE